MTLHEIIEEIKEMEREIKFPEDLYEAGKKDALCAVLNFLTKDEAEKKDVNFLEKEIIKAAERFPEVSFAKLSRIAKRFYELGCRHVAVLYDDIEFERQRRAEQEPEGLEKAAEKHISNVFDAVGHPGWDWEMQDVLDAFKAGAKWMAEQEGKK